MASIKEMREFESFVLRTHRLVINWVGRNRVTFTRSGQIEMECDIKKREDGRLRITIRGDDDEKGGRLRRFLQLLRFHVTASHPNRYARALDAYENREGDCKRQKCFQYMRDAFPEEWALFTGQDAAPLKMTSVSTRKAAAISSTPTTAPHQPIIVNTNSSNGNGGDRIAAAIENLIGLLTQSTDTTSASAHTIQSTREGSLARYEDCFEKELDRFNAGLQSLIDEAAAEDNRLNCLDC